MALEINSGKIQYMKTHLIVSREEWLSARKALLIEEKKQTRARDEPMNLPGSAANCRGCESRSLTFSMGRTERKPSANCSPAAVS
jgi:Bacterial protein of unknown function (DUF899)